MKGTGRIQFIQKQNACVSVPVGSDVLTLCLLVNEPPTSFSLSQRNLPTTFSLLGLFITSQHAPFAHTLQISKRRALPNRRTSSLSGPDSAEDEDSDEAIEDARKDEPKEVGFEVGLGLPGGAVYLGI